MAFSDDDIAAECAELFGPAQLSDRPLDKEVVGIQEGGNSVVAKKHHWEIRRDLRLAFKLGLSIRAAAKFAGCSNPTALKWARAYPQRLCGCGRLAHNGWCRWRFERSPLRQAYVRSQPGGPFRKVCRVAVRHRAG
jgi:hypothetical protein